MSSAIKKNLDSSNLFSKAPDSVVPFNRNFCEDYLKKLRDIIYALQTGDRSKASVSTKVIIFDECVSEISRRARPILHSAGLNSLSQMSAYHWHQLYNELHLDHRVSTKPYNSESLERVSNILALLRSLGDNALIPPFWRPLELSRHNPFFVFARPEGLKGIRPIYEFSQFAPRLGYQFVIDACNVIVAMRTEAHVNERTWINNYVTKIGFLFEHFGKFLNFSGVTCVEKMSHENWQAFLGYISKEIFSNEPSEKTGIPRTYARKNAVRINLNNLFGRLAIANVVSARFEIPDGDNKKKTSDKQSRFSPVKRQPERFDVFVDSPFSFWIGGHNRGYDYSRFQKIGRSFLIEILPTVNSLYSKYTCQSAKHFHSTLLSFLEFLQNLYLEGTDVEFFELLASTRFRKIDDILWEAKVYQWKEQLINKNNLRQFPNKPQTQSAKFKKLNLIWASLVTEDLVPHIYIKGIKNAKAKSEQRARPSLAQLSAKKGSTLSYVERNEVANNLSRFFDNVDKPEAVEFISALCESLPAIEVRRLTLDALLEKIRVINNLRLKVLRKCAEDEFIRWHAHWEQGQLAMRNAVLSKDELVDLLDNELRSISERRRNCTRLIGDNSPHQLGNSLNLILAQHDGIITAVNGRYHHMRRRLGGDAIVHAYLHPHPMATVALWTILLIDTGANCEVVREMPFNCLHKCSNPDYMNISFGLKARSNYNRISDQLARAPAEGQRLSAIGALMKYQDMTACYRKFCHDSVNEFLFLSTRNGKIIGLTEFEARKEFVTFRDAYRELDGLKILPSSIRPSYLLKIQHDDAKGRTEVAQGAADHISMTTTNTYTLRAPTKLMYAQKIREFQELFQTVIVSSIDGAAEKLGLSKEEAARLFSEATRSGLGIACLNSKAGIQPGTRTGEDCQSFHACPNCEMRYLVGTIENIADLILFNEHLKANEEIALQFGSLSFEKRWLPWLVLSTIALAKFAQGETASAFVQAQILAARRRPSYISFPLE